MLSGQWVVHSAGGVCGLTGTPTVFRIIFMVRSDRAGGREEVACWRMMSGLSGGETGSGGSARSSDRGGVRAPPAGAGIGSRL